MRSVGTELALALDAELDSLQHPVHHSREIRDLVRPPRHRDPLANVGGRDRLGTTRDSTHRRQHTTYEEPDEGAREQNDHGNHD